MRKVALVLAALILPACETRSRRDNVHVAIHNQGATETVRVMMHLEREGRSDIDRDFLVAAGDSAFFDDDAVTRLEIRIYRNSDGFKIFDDFWTADDLRREHDSVDVTVTP